MALERAPFRRVRVESGRGCDPGVRVASVCAVTARPDLPSGGSSAPAATPQPTSSDRPSGAPLRAAIAVAVVGALLVSLGPLLGLVDPGATAEHDFSRDADFTRAPAEGTPPTRRCVCRSGR